MSSIFVSGDATPFSSTAVLQNMTNVVSKAIRTATVHTSSKKTTAVPVQEEKGVADSKVTEKGIFPISLVTSVLKVTFLI